MTMKPYRISQNLEKDFKKMPPHHSLIKLHSYLVTLSSTSRSEDEAEHLMEVILKYIDIVLNECATKSCREQIKICKQWFDILQEVVTENISRVFIKATTLGIFDILLEEDVKIWCVKKEILKTFLLCIQKCPKEFRIKHVKELPDFYLFKIIDLISTYGDYDFQVTLIEVVFRMYGKNMILPKLKDLIPESRELSESFAKISGDTFDEDVRKFLNILNENSGKVFSIVCKEVFLGLTKCGETIENINGLWVDFNLSEEAISFYYTGTFSNNDATLWNLVLFFVSDVAIVQVHRAPISDEAIICIKLKRSYISTYDDSDWLEKASDIKLVVSCSNSKATTLLTKILPDMFKRKLQHDNKKISLGNKKVYKPLEVLLYRKSRSESSKCNMEISGFSTCLEPIVKTHTNSTQNTTRVFTVSSTSTKCEVISVSDSSIHSNAGPLPKQTANQNQIEHAQICLVENSAMTSSSNKISPVKRVLATFTNNSCYDKDLQLSQECVQILSAWCSSSKLRRFQKSSKSLSASAMVPFTSEIPKSEVGMSKTLQELCSFKCIEKVVDHVDEQNRVETVEEILENKVSKSEAGYTKNAEKCSSSEFFSDVPSNANKPKSAENFDCLGSVSLIPQNTPHKDSISVTGYAKVVENLSDQVQKKNSLESTGCFETAQTSLHEKSKSNVKNIEKHSLSKFSKDANGQILSDNMDHFETAREVFLSSPNKISNSEMVHPKKTEKCSSSEVFRNTSVVKNKESITFGLKRLPQLTSFQGIMETGPSTSENQSMLNKGGKQTIRKGKKRRPTPLLKEVMEESRICSNSESKLATFRLKTFDGDLRSVSDAVLEGIRNTSQVDQFSKDPASTPSKLGEKHVRSDLEDELEVYGNRKRKVFEELVTEKSRKKNNVTIPQKNLNYKERMESDKENFPKIYKESEEVVALMDSKSKRKIKEYVTENLLPLEDLHEEENVCQQNQKILTKERSFSLQKVSPPKMKDKDGGLPEAQIENYEGSIQRLCTNHVMEVLGQEDLPASVEMIKTQVAEQSCVTLFSKLPKEVNQPPSRSFLDDVDMLNDANSHSLKESNLKCQIFGGDISVDKSNNTFERMKFCETMCDQIKKNDEEKQSSFVNNQYNETFKIDKLVDGDIPCNESGSKEGDIVAEEINQEAQLASTTDHKQEEVKVKKVIQHREPAEVEDNKMVLNHRSMTSQSCGRQKWFDMNDISYFEKIQVSKEENRIDEKAEEEDLVQWKAVQLAPTTGRVYRKKQRNVKGSDKLDQKRKKRRKHHTGYPEEMLNLNRNNYLQTAFHEILESFREETNLNFLDKVKPATQERSRNVHHNQSTKQKHEKHETKFFPKRKKPDLMDKQVRVVMNEELADTSLRLKRKHHMMDDDPADIPLMSEEPVLRLPEVSLSKKINIISDIQIVPGRDMQHYSDELPLKKINNANEDLSADLQNCSKNMNTKEVDLEMDAPKYSQRTSERRFVLKHMYSTLENLLGEPEDTQEYRDIVMGCKIFKKYI